MYEISEDVLVEFEFESMPVPDEGPAEDIETLDALSFAIVSLIIALLFMLERKQK